MSVYLLVFGTNSGHLATIFDPATQSFQRECKQNRFQEPALSDLYTLNPAQIVMYTTQYCADCHRASAFFEVNNIAYHRVSLEGNEEATRFVMSVNRGFQSVPTIIFPDGSILSEPTWQELKEKTTGG